MYAILHVLDATSLRPTSFFRFFHWKSLIKLINQCHVNIMNISYSIYKAAVKRMSHTHEMKIFFWC